MRDERAAAMNRRPFLVSVQRAKCGRGDELVSPTRGHHVLIANERTRMRELNRRRRQRGDERIGTENHNRWYAH